jgi:hypothetical protein
MPSQDELHSWAVRAYQTWPLLTFGAKQRHVFTYGELGQHLGLPNIAVGHALGAIYRYCETHGLPKLTSIVVRNDSGKPGFAEFDNCDIPGEQARVFSYQWFDEENHAMPVPSVEDLQGALKSAAAVDA